MRKTYRYRNLSFPVTDETEVKLTVDFISDGNLGQTVINVPGPQDLEIENEGTVPIGKGEDLRSETTVIVSDVANLAPAEDEVRIRYKMNDKTILEHANPKSEEERPLIMLFINFPQQL